MPFKAGLFDCFNDFNWCLITYFVPCYTAGKIAESVDENCLLCGFLSILGPIGIGSRTVIRGKLREKNGIEGSPINDCIMHTCCGACALCQEAAEMQ